MTTPEMIKIRYPDIIIIAQGLCINDINLPVSTLQYK